MRSTRRRVLASGVTFFGTVGVAGCLGGDAEDDGGDDDHAEDDHDDHDDDNHLSIAEFEVIDRDHDDVAAYVHDDHWHGNLPTVPLDANISLGASIEDEDGNEIVLGDDLELRVAITDSADDSIVSFDYHGDHVHIIGEEAGITEVVFLLWHDDHADYQSPPIVVQVSEDDDHDHDDDHHHHEMEISRFDIIDRSSDTVTAELHDDHWDGELPNVPIDDNISLGAVVEDEHGDEIHLGNDLELRVRLEDGADDIVSFDYHGDHVHIIGQEDGHSAVVFQLWHDDHADYETAPIDVGVGEHNDDR